MTVSHYIQFLRPDPASPGCTTTLGEALARLQAAAEAQQCEPALADAVAIDALMHGVGEPRMSIVPDGFEDLDDEEPAGMALAS
ncbi:MAG: hypothetical protein PVI30_21480 [Myxococcales bacterium]